MSCNYSRIAKTVLILAALPLGGCLSMHGNPTLDAMTAALGANKQYVEAYIEFPGPQERWAGPVGMVIHVKAKEGAPIEVAVTPHTFQPRAVTPVLAKGEGGASRAPAAVTTMTSDEARERLGMLATALSSGDTEFHGCITPIRVRLIRSDGALLDKRGCRVQSGWAQLASEVASEMMASAAK